MRGWFPKIRWAMVVWAALMLAAAHPPSGVSGSQGGNAPAPGSNPILAQAKAQDAAVVPEERATGPQAPANAGRDAPLPGGEDPGGSTPSEEGFVPTEKVKADQAVDFPADI